jgi:hypothetical protein
MEQRVDSAGFQLKIHSSLLPWLCIPVEINMGSWPSWLGKSWTWDSKIWAQALWDLDLRMTALTRCRSGCKVQTHPLTREDIPHWQTHNCLTVIKIWSWAQNGCPTWQTGWLTVGDNITSAAVVVKKDISHIYAYLPPLLSSEATLSVSQLVSVKYCFHLFASISVRNA